MLTPDPKTPVMAETAMGPDLLQSLQIITEFAVNIICQNLAVLAIHNIALTIEEP